MTGRGRAALIRTAVSEQGWLRATHRAKPGSAALSHLRCRAGLGRGSGVAGSTRTGRAVALDQDDPRVIAARQAERRLYGYYGLAPARHLVALPRLGLRVRLTEVGSGPPVLVVPGNTGDGFPFAPLLPHLPGRRVIVLNRPGGGLSEGMDHTTTGFRSTEDPARAVG
jgi:hypothetical protein